MKRGTRALALGACAALALAVWSGATLAGKKDKKNRKAKDDPYAEFVWPPPPDEARIKLEDIISRRSDVEATSKLRKALVGAAPQSPYDKLVKPHAVEFDAQGRILVTDAATNALIRFDREGERMDVIGTQGNVRLALPLGLDVAEDGTIYVASATARQVVAFDPEGSVVAVYGRGEELTNPTDAALTPDGSRLFVTDSKAHRIVVFDAESAEVVNVFGSRGEGEGQFGWPTSLTFDLDGNLYVVDQINSRVQVFDADGEFVDAFGSLGVGFANFVRPKDVAVDEVGFIYVTDNAFNNMQLFDADFTLLTFVGSGGSGPGRFFGASGVAVRGERFAIVDQLGARVQLFRFVVPKDR